ncbi:uncharacterized protein LOC127279311 [Leptopilina boulardi]|uniref:uncharacterized protein LOC127279311 n=1 Tax=Leptopilina boulardi TaxID=63433 RepID=UPI0021F4FFFC|nr:uncharacterized protein LOC127279311 [Leptopilina boulardi]
MDDDLIFAHSFSEAINTFVNDYKPLQHNQEEDCLKRLINYQNISCVLVNAAYHVNKYEAKNGKSEKVKLKILEEAVAYSTNSFSAVSLSPFIDRFNELMLKASEFGFLKDFYEPVVDPITEIIEPELIKKEKLFPVLFGALIIGYSLSLIAFICEIITSKIKRKFFNKPKFRFVN